MMSSDDDESMKKRTRWRMKKRKGSREEVEPVV